MKKLFNNEDNIENLNAVLKLTRNPGGLKRGCYSVLTQEEEK